VYLVSQQLCTDIRPLFTPNYLYSCRSQYRTICRNGDQKIQSTLFRTLGIYLPLITTNCAILGFAIFATNRGYNLLEGLIFALGAGGGFTLALVLMAGLREENELSNVPNLMKGTAMSLIIAGILSLAFMGFSGLFSS